MRIGLATYAFPDLTVVDAVKMCDEFNMLACFENRPDAESHLRDLHDFKGFIEDVPGAKLCFDTSHYYMWKGDVDAMSEVIKELADDIGIVHLVDTFKGQDAHMLPGYGEISLRHIVPVFMKMPNLKKTPFIFEDQEPYEYEQGILNLRHAFISKKGMLDRNKDGCAEMFAGEGVK